MIDDKKITSFISFILPLCMGLIIGLLLFNPSEGFIVWWDSIDWGSQSVANVGAWVAGIATTLAALATASAATSSAKAADAATQSANQWKLHASYDKYIDAGVKARIKLRWLEAHLKHMCENRFQVFFDKGTNVIGEYPKNNADAFLSCLEPNPNHIDPDAIKRFNKYKKEFKYQSDRINEIYPDAFDITEETYELSKNHVGLTEVEKIVILRVIEKLMGQLMMISRLYQEVIEPSEKSHDAKKVNIDSCLNCDGASRHYYRSTLSNLRLISGYIDNLVIDSDRRCCSNQGTIPQFGDLIS